MLTGSCEAIGSRLWRIALQPGESNLPSMHNDTHLDTLAAYSAYDLPIVADLIRYFHAASGYPVRSTWLKSIGDGYYSSWPGLTLANATKCCPDVDATIMGHLVQKNAKGSGPLNLSPQQQVHLRSQSPVSSQNTISSKYGYISGI